jgi:hypothetical protein
MGSTKWVLAAWALGIGLALNAPSLAAAGCCLTGGTTYTDYVGYAVFPTGNSNCTWHFDHCTISVYSYEYCEQGPDEVLSFRVHPGASCSFYSILCLNTMASCGYVPTSTGQAYECTRTCSP